MVIDSIFGSASLIGTEGAAVSLLNDCEWITEAFRTGGKWAAGQSVAVCPT